jgi:hypothetical protein
MTGHVGEHTHYSWYGSDKKVHYTLDEEEAYQGGKENGSGWVSEVIPASQTCYGFPDDKPIEVIAQNQDLNRQQLPRTLIGCDVVMAMMMPDQEGLLPRRHIVTLRARNKMPQYQFSTHYVAYQPGWNGQDGPWVLHFGHYDKSRRAAILDMIAREKVERGPLW